MHLINNSREHWIFDFWKGILLTIPILLVYLAMGVTFGVLAIDSGLSPFNVILMSLLIYAGTAQLVGIQLFNLEASPISIVFTTIVINARFFIMSSSIVTFLENYSFFQRLFYSIQMTDATFAIHTNRFSQTKPSKIEIFTTNGVGHFVWVLSTILGIYLGKSSYNLENLAIDYAMPSMFIGLLVPLVTDKIQLIVIIFSALGTLAFYSLGLSFWTTLAASMLGIFLGFGLDLWNKK